MTSHEQHATDDLTDVASEIRVLLTDMLKSAQNVLPKFHGHLNDITFYNHQLGKEREKLREEIIEQVDHCKLYVDSVSLLLDLDLKCLKKHDHLIGRNIGLYRNAVVSCILNKQKTVSD